MRIDVVFFENPSLSRDPQTGENSARAAIADGQPVFGSHRSNEQEDQNDIQYDPEAFLHNTGLSIVPDHNAAPRQMPECLKQSLREYHTQLTLAQSTDNVLVTSSAWRAPTPRRWLRRALVQRALERAWVQAGAGHAGRAPWPHFPPRGRHLSAIRSRE